MNKVKLALILILTTCDAALAKQFAINFWRTVTVPGVFGLSCAYLGYNFNEQSEVQKTIFFVSGWLLLVLIGVASIMKLRKNSGSKQGLWMSPGKNILHVSEFVFSKKFIKCVCEPAISDMREEYFEALSQNRIWKARWVRIRGTYSFFAAIGLDRVFAFVSFFVRVWKSVN